VRFAPSLKTLEDRTLLSGATATWTAVGPGPIQNAANVIGPAPATTQSVGAVNALAVDPANPKHVFAATVNGGVWQTSDFTAPTPAWTTTTDLMPSLAISTVAISPVNPGGLPSTEVIYAGTGDYSSDGGTFSSAIPFAPRVAPQGGPAVGLYKSSDGGATWQVLNPKNAANPAGQFTGLRIERIIPTALNGGQTVFLATADTGVDAMGKPTGGVYRSDDGGVTWTINPVAPSVPGVTDLVENPANPNQFFAAVPNSLSAAAAGIYRLDLGVGPTWTNVATATNGFTDLGASTLRIELSVSPAGANPVWASVINTTGFYQRVYRGVAAGGGMTWTQIGPTVSGGAQPPDLFASGLNQGRLFGAIVADPAADNLVYVAGDSTSVFPFTGYVARGNSAAATPAGIWTALTPNPNRTGAPPAPNGPGPVDLGKAVPTTNGVTTGPHADSREMVFASGGVLLLACDGGIYQCTSPTGGFGAQTWSGVTGTIQDTELYGAALDDKNNNDPRKS
jgi:hypothetical protein